MKCSCMHPSPFYGPAIRVRYMRADGLPTNADCEFRTDRAESSQGQGVCVVVSTGRTTDPLSPGTVIGPGDITALPTGELGTRGQLCARDRDRAELESLFSGPPWSDLRDRLVFERENITEADRCQNATTQPYHEARNGL